jgi:hypothetical protein
VVTEQVEYRGFSAEIGLDDKVRPLLPENGKWADEPDYLKTIHEETGYTILIRRARSGALCGYVGVDESHPLHSLVYQDCTHIQSRVPTEEQINKHCEFMEGFTESEFGISFPKWPERLKEQMRREYAARLICPTGEDYCEHQIQAMFTAHGGITFSGEWDDDGKWYIGFDCSHSNDYLPAYVAMTEGMAELMKNNVYRDLDYVLEECINLANQIYKYENDCTTIY